MSMLVMRWPRPSNLPENGISGNLLTPIGTQTYCCRSMSEVWASVEPERSWACWPFRPFTSLMIHASSSGDLISSWGNGTSSGSLFVPITVRVGIFLTTLAQVQPKKTVSLGVTAILSVMPGLCSKINPGWSAIDCL